MRAITAFGAALVLLACGGAAVDGAGEAAPSACEGDGCRAASAALECVTAEAVAPGSTAGSNDAIDEALAGIGFERGSLGIADAHLATSKLDTKDERILNATQSGLRDPERLPAWGRAVASALDRALASDTPVTSAILAASAIRESAASACVDPAWTEIPPGDAPLARALGREGGIDGVPLELQRALVPIVRAMFALHEEIVRARGDAALLQPASVVPSWILGVRRFELSPSVVQTFETIDVARIVASGASLARVVEQARLERFAGADVASIDLDTPIGSIVLRGPGADTFASDESPALLLDTGGDDVYRAPVGAATLARPVAIAIDLGGSDTYGYAESDDEEEGRLPSDAAGRHEGGRTLSQTGRQGSGTLGVGLLFDLGKKNDRYRSLVGSQGAGSHGVGVLYDDGGDDRYESEGFSQGAAAWGVGLLLDRDGDDRYVLHNSGQGFGFARGVGALVDARGSDTFRAVPKESVLYPADQLAGQANHSFAQGCGAGHRPDWPDVGYPFPGGIGILRDASGSDRYEAGVFAQACGFVLGLGALLDGKGDDTYEGLYYVQGASAHVGAAVFLDESGDDRYDPTFAVAGPALGFAHDLSVAVHADMGGDDRYRATWMSYGAGLANGVALFVNDGGKDRYETDDDKSFGFGATSDVRPERKELPTVGVFVRAGGPSAYVVEGNAVDRAGRSWRSGSSSAELGVGVDRPNKRASF